MKQNFFALMIIALAISCSTSNDPGKGKLMSDSGVSRDGFSMVIFHINDTHSQFEESSIKLKLAGKKTYAKIGGYARLSTLLSRLRSGPYKNKAQLFVQPGDSFQGTLYFHQNRGMTGAKMLNYLKLDAFSVGNHEFDNGSPALSSFIEKAKFPVLATNVDAKGDKLLSGRLKPYIIKNFNGNRVAVLGLVVTGTREISSPSKKTIFTDEYEAATRFIQKLKADGVNKIILLTHLGYEEDLKLAAKLKDVDVIVGGHSHSLLGDMENINLSAEGKYPTRVKDADGKITCVTQAWEKAKALGIIELKFDKDGNILKCQGQLKLLVGDEFKRKNSAGKKVAVTPMVKKEITDFIATSPNITIAAKDQNLLKMLKPFKDKVDALAKEKIGVVKEELLHIRKPGKHTSGVKLQKGSHLAPVIGDAYAWKLEKIGLHFDAIISNAGGIRKDLAAGDLYVSDIYEVLPYDNSLVYFDIKGIDLEKILQKAIAGKGGGFPYCYRMKLDIDMTKPQGKNLRALTFLKNGKWIPFDKNRTYRIVTNSYLLSGGDNYDFSSASNVVDTGFIGNQTLLEYVKENGVLKKSPYTFINYKD